MLSQRVRSHVRAVDEIVVDPARGLGVIIRSGHPEAPGIVAERLRAALALGADETRRGRQHRRAHRAAETGASQERAQPMMLRLGVGHAAFEPRSADAALDGGLDAAIRDACRPRMLISLPLEALSPRAPAARPAPDARMPDADGVAPDPDMSQPAQDMSPDEPGTTGETIGAPRLRLVRLPYGREKESAALRERARLLGVPFAHLPAHLSSSCRRALAPDLAREVRAVAIGRTRSTLTVAMDDPRDANAVLRLRAATGLAIFPVLAPAQEIARALAEFD
jgi:hypothetical protein